jgi:hypothetical protein
VTIVFAATLFGVLAGVIGQLVYNNFNPPLIPQTALPLPHHIAKYPDGVTLRFAMVNDVLTERFAKHGPAYYTERNRQVRAELEEIKAHRKPGEKLSEKYFGLLDDLGVGLEAIGEPDLAVQTLRDKLNEQLAQGIAGRQLYTTYANLGTFLVHRNMAKARAGDPPARQQMREGLDFIRKSIEVNPDAHFGRQIWQEAAVEFIVAALDDPQLLLKFDMIGNSLQAEVDPSQKRCFTEHEAPWGQNARQANDEMRHFDVKPDDRLQGYLLDYRRSITRAGAEGNWKETVKTSHPNPAPFDEPALGFTGMWRVGGAANPHFALVLGEIMMRVGQRFLAWTAYERAASMADNFWPDAKIQAKFLEHCRKRQKVIESQLVSENWSDRRRQFHAELDFGHRYQAAYEEYEAKSIQEGASIDDPHFYDAFHAEHGPIASPVGPEDKFMVENDNIGMPSISLSPVILFAGLFAFIAACCVRLFRTSKTVNVTPV